MRKILGISCIILGIFCLLSSVGFVVYNRMESKSAEASSTILLQDVQKKITQKVQEAVSQEKVDEETYEEPSGQMVPVPLDGYDAIGILSIPALEVELPVLSDWSYEKLKKAPCHYHGSCYGTDFVIAAHNYPAHFGRLSELQPEDLILFTDTTGAVHCYQVSLIETLSATATEEMITSGFDLSLYTCTPGGSNRVTVRCEKVHNVQKDRSP